METALFYILKASICLTFLYLGYKCLLSKETFFKFNRTVLLLGIFISLILPIIEIEISTTPVIAQKTITQIENIVLQNDNSAPVLADVEIEQPKIEEPLPTAINTTTPSIVEKKEAKEPIVIPWFKIVVAVYLLGFIINLSMLIISYFRMIFLIKSGEKRNYNNLTYVVLDTDIAPFSWRKYIVLSNKDNQDIDAIITHEAAHVAHKHYLDILFTELVLAFHWFNPFAWKLKQELKDIHEYQADNSVLQSGIEATTYQLLILEKAVGSSSYALANSFNHSKIKKRITMMLKQKSKDWNRLKLLFFIPVTMLAVYAFACTKVNSESKNNEFLSELKSPQVFFPPVSSKLSTRVIPFGQATDTVANYTTDHLGWDFLAPKGSPVHAFKDGIVIESYKDAIHGNLIKIKHSPELETWYGQNEKNLVKEGDRVKTGQLIAYVGNSGVASIETETDEPKGSHLHFEMLVYGLSVSPMVVIDPKEEELNDKMLKLIDKRNETCHPFPTSTSMELMLNERNYSTRIESYNLKLKSNRGDTIYAAKNGIVLSTAREQQGYYGNTIAIQHEDSLITLYAKCDEILVPYSRILVEAGEPIAIASKNNSTEESLVLFHTLIGHTPQNPVEVLREVFLNEKKTISNFSIIHMPIDETDLKRIPSGYGMRSDPITGQKKMHTGLDFSASEGTPILTIYDGVVTVAENDKKQGNYIIIDHGNGLQSQYHHNQENLVAVGDRVKTGQKIALVGSTGQSTGPHLHFEVLVNGAHIDPNSIWGTQIIDNSSFYICDPSISELLFPTKEYPTIPVD